MNEDDFVQDASNGWRMNGGPWEFVRVSFESVDWLLVPRPRPGEFHASSEVEIA